eukprot:scaffold3452_cov61-Phaeocystis_antarctica.AAC.4
MRAVRGAHGGRFATRARSGSSRPPLGGVWPRGYSQRGAARGVAKGLQMQFGWGPATHLYEEAHVTRPLLQHDLTGGDLDTHQPHTRLRRAAAAQSIETLLGHVAEAVGEVVRHGAAAAARLAVEVAVEAMRVTQLLGLIDVVALGEERVGAL